MRETLQLILRRQKFSKPHEEASDEDLSRLRYDGETQDDSASGPSNSFDDPTAPAQEDPFKDVPVLSRTPAELYVFDTDTDSFVMQEKDVSVDIASNAEFDSKF